MTKYSIIILALLTLVWGVEGISDATNLTAPLTNESVKIEEVYAPSSSLIFQEWTAIAAPTTTADRLCHATVYAPINDKIYMIGGNPTGTAGSYQSLCQQYDPVTNIWTDREPMTTARGWVYGSYVRGKIYVIGGLGNAGVTAVNEEYDIALNTWTTKAPRPTAMGCDLEVVWRDSLIYVMGGWNGVSGGSGSTTVDIYNPFTNTWSVGTALPMNADMGTAAIIGDTIYITNAVNRQGSSSFWWSILCKGAINPANPLQITWIPGPTFPQPTLDAGTAVLGGNIYWLGGFITTTTVTNHCWKYEPSSNTISTVVPYPQIIARCNYMVSRPSANELYVMAGDAGGNWAAPNNYYYKISYTLPAANDVGVNTIVSPFGSHRINTTMTPVAQVKNFGTNAQTNFQVVCSILGPGGGMRYTDTLTVASLTSGATTNVNFTSWTPTIEETLTVMMKTTLASDENPANDRKTETVLIGDWLLTEGFNGTTWPPTGWQVIILQGTHNWERRTSNANPTCTPYEGEAMASYQADDEQIRGANARLISPPLTLGTTPVICSLKFFMYHDNRYPPGSFFGPDSVRVEYSLDGTNFTRVVAFCRYSPTNGWVAHSVNLGTFSGTVYIGLLAWCDYGNNMNIDYARMFSYYIPGIEEASSNNLPKITSLSASNPNPITNGLAKISFTISEPAKASLKIYDASGRMVRTLVNSKLDKGVYNLTWNGTDDNNNAVAEGIYFYTLKTDNHNSTKKLVMMR
jgi:hypothetical protein